MLSASHWCVILKNIQLLQIMAAVGQMSLFKSQLLRLSTDATNCHKTFTCHNVSFEKPKYT